MFQCRHSSLHYNQGSLMRFKIVFENINMKGKTFFYSDLLSGCLGPTSFNSHPDSHACPAAQYRAWTSTWCPPCTGSSASAASSWCCWPVQRRAIQSQLLWIDCTASRRPPNIATFSPSGSWRCVQFADILQLACASYVQPPLPNLPRHLIPSTFFPLSDLPQSKACSTWLLNYVLSNYTAEWFDHASTMINLCQDMLNIVSARFPFHDWSCSQQLRIIMTSGKPLLLQISLKAKERRWRACRWLGKATIPLRD